MDIPRVPTPAPRIVPSTLGTWGRLFGYVGPYRGAFALGLLGGFMYSGAMASFALFAKWLGDGTFTRRDPRTIVWLPLALIGLFVLRGLGDFTQTYFMGYVGRRVVARLRAQLFARLLRVPIGYSDRNPSALMLSRLTYNTEQIGTAVTDSVVSFARTALQIVYSIVVLLWLNLKLALLALTMGPLVVWLASIINRHFRRYSRRIQDSMGDVTRVAKEGLESPRLIKVYNAEDHLDGKFQTANEHNRRSNMKLIFTKGLSNPIVQLVTASGAAVVLSIAIADAIHGRMSMGDLLGFFAALVAIGQPLRELIGSTGLLQQGVVAAQSLFEVIDEPTEPAGGDYVATRVRGAVEFRQVSFTYESASVVALREVSFEVAPGTRIAIVGRSGSGKSTLVNLLPRFYDVSSGSVRIDGRDVREYELHNLREQIAVVSQDVVLFNDSIRNNITFGRAASSDAVESAALAAHVLEFVENQPAGLETVVGDRGVLLSGGQRQRIAIARALLKNAPILILDEATSALDTEAERHVQAGLSQLMRDRTTFVIAHRLSTVEQADRILVMDEGAIVESGTHAELLARNGVYSQLHRLQFND
jgi:subfamily B ATP-binding cassette protein MsbA